MEPLQQLIEQLESEAIKIEVQGRALRADEMARVQAIHQALPLLRQARDVLSVEVTEHLVTYKIVDDKDGKLKTSGRTACNFWNHYISPGYDVVIRLGTFTQASNTIARAYMPSRKDGVAYGRVEFNTKYLDSFTTNEISGTIVHEIGHTLGIGWTDWMELFDEATGKFTDAAVAQLKSLEEMLVETDYGDGTAYAHWDEETFGEEMMTGLKNPTGEHVLPITIDVMGVLGHHVVERLPGKTHIDVLLNMLSQMIFSRKVQARLIDRDYFKETELMETIPHGDPVVMDEDAS